MQDNSNVWAARVYTLLEVRRCRSWVSVLGSEVLEKGKAANFD
jgi:hypothetical protein